MSKVIRIRVKDDKKQTPIGNVLRNRPRNKHDFPSVPELLARVGLLKDGKIRLMEKADEWLPLNDAKTGKATGQELHLQVAFRACGVYNPKCSALMVTNIPTVWALQTKDKFLKTLEIAFYGKLSPEWSPSFSDAQRRLCCPGCGNTFVPPAGRVRKIYCKDAAPEYGRSATRDVEPSATTWALVVLSDRNDAAAFAKAKHIRSDEFLSAAADFAGSSVGGLSRQRSFDGESFVQSRIELDAIDPTPRHRVAFRASRDAPVYAKKIPLALPNLPDAMLQEVPEDARMLIPPPGIPPPGIPYIHRTPVWNKSIPMREAEFRERAREAERFLQTGPMHLEETIKQGWDQLRRCNKCQHGGNCKCANCHGGDCLCYDISLKAAVKTVMGSNRFGQTSPSAGDRSDADDDLGTPSQVNDKLLGLWRAVEVDGSGTLDEKELRHVMEGMGKKMEDKDFKKAFLHLDKDGSGSVDFDEFCIWWHREYTCPPKSELSGDQAWTRNATRVRAHYEVTQEAFSGWWKNLQQEQYQTQFDEYWRRCVSEQRQDGLLIVRVSNCEDLMWADKKNRSSDPYVVLTMYEWVPSTGSYRVDQQFNTKTIKSSLNPHYDETFAFKCFAHCSETFDQLFVEVFDANKIGKSKKLGETTLELSSVFEDGWHVTAREQYPLQRPEREEVVSRAKKQSFRMSMAEEADDGSAGVENRGGPGEVGLRLKFVPQKIGR